MTKSLNTIDLVNLNNIYLGNNQNIQYIKHSKYRQDSETSNYCFYKSVSQSCFFGLRTINYDMFGILSFFKTVFQISGIVGY